MSEVRLASIEADVRDLRWMFRQICPYGSATLMTISSRKVETYSTSPANIAESYCSFNEQFLDDITLYAGDTVEGILSIPDIDSFLRHMKGTDRVQLQFFGRGHDEVNPTGADQSWWILIRSNLNKWSPTGIPSTELRDRRDEFSSQFSRQEQLMTQTQLDTYQEVLRVPSVQLQKLTELTDDITKGGTEFEEKTIESIYPLMIEDGSWVFPDFLLDEGAKIRFYPYFVDSEATERYYTREFKQIVDNLNGEVSLSIHPNEKRLSIVQQNRRGCTLKHVLKQVNMSRDEFKTAVLE